MNEQIRPNPELTHGVVSHTLDTRSIMPEPQNNREQSREQQQRPEQLSVQGSSVDATQAMRIILQAARDEAGRDLTTAETLSYLGRMTQTSGEGRGQQRPPLGRIEIRGAAEISTDDLTDQKVIDAINRLNAKLGNKILKDRINLLEELNRLYSLDTKIDDIEKAGERLTVFIQQQAEGQEDERENRFRSLSLQIADMKELDKSSEKWLDDQFDILYSIARSGELLDSPQVNAIQSKFNEAVTYLIDLQKRPDGRQVTYKEIEDVQRTFNIRLNSIFARASIDRRSLEGIQGAVQRLGANGLITSLSFDGGRTGAVFNRMNQMADEMRIREGGISKKDGTELHHLSPEIIKKMEFELQREQMDLAIKHGIGVFADSYKEYQRTDPGNAKKLLEREILRSVRTAFDAFGTSQRQAVIASHGRKLEGDYAFFTDPKSIFDMFNLQEFLTGKWNSLTNEQLQFFRKIKIDLARHEVKNKDTAHMSEAQLEELGARLFRELFTTPDFFSSGWRIQGVLDQIDRVQNYYVYNEEIAKDIFGAGRGISGDPEFQEKIRQVEESIRLQAGLEQVPSGKYEAYREKMYSKFLAEGIEGQDGNTLVFSFEERQLYISRLNLSIAEKEDMVARKNKRSDSLALFMKLKKNGIGTSEKDEKEKKEKATELWRKIKTYRAEDIVKIIRERKGRIGDKQALEELNAVFENAGVRVGVTENLEGKKTTIQAFDTFLKDYKPALSAIREEALRTHPPQAVDFRNLSPEHAAMANAVLGSGGAEKIKAIFKAMDGYIDKNNIIYELVHSSEYEDIYFRTLHVDDSIVDQLEVTPENSGLQVGQLTDYWSSERGGDALVRNFNDLGNGQKAGGALVAFLKAEGKDKYKEQAQAAAVSTAEYNGPGAAAKVFRYTFGSYLLIAEQDYMWDIINAGKLPFRLKSSDMERIFGVGVDPLTREQLLREMDHVRGLLISEDLDDPKKYYNELMNTLGIDSMSRVRDKGFNIFLYMMLLLLMTPAVGLKEAVSSSTK